MTKDQECFEKPLAVVGYAIAAFWLWPLAPLIVANALLPKPAEPYRRYGKKQL